MAFFAFSLALHSPGHFFPPLARLLKRILFFFLLVQHSHFPTNSQQQWCEKRAFVYCFPPLFSYPKMHAHCWREGSRLLLASFSGKTKLRSFCVFVEKSCNHRIGAKLNTPTDILISVDKVQKRDFMIQDPGLPQLLSSSAPDAFDWLDDHPRKETEGLAMHIKHF